MTRSYLSWVVSLAAACLCLELENKGSFPEIIPLSNSAPHLQSLLPTILCVWLIKLRTKSTLNRYHLSVCECNPYLTRNTTFLPPGQAELYSVLFELFLSCTKSGNFFQPSYEKDVNWMDSAQLLVKWKSLCKSSLFHLCLSSLPCIHHCVSLLVWYILVCFLNQLSKGARDICKLSFLTSQFGGPFLDRPPHGSPKCLLISL